MMMKKMNQLAKEDYVNRLPDEILLEIINRIPEAEYLFNLSLVSKKFASLVPCHSAGTITLQLPVTRYDCENIRCQFIASFANFLKKLCLIRTLHLKVTHKNHTFHTYVEFRPKKPPMILILYAIMEEDHYMELLDGYVECERWLIPLKRLLYDNGEEKKGMIMGTTKERVSENKSLWILCDDTKLKLPKSGHVMEVLLSVTRAAWDDDDEAGVFFSNTRGKDTVLLEIVREAMKHKPSGVKRVIR